MREVKQGQDLVSVRCKYTMRGRGAIVDRKSVTWELSQVSKHPSSKIECEDLYTIYPSGDVVIASTCYLSPALPPVARVGLQFTMAKGLDRFTWYGRGPYESQVDR